MVGIEVKGLRKAFSDQTVVDNVSFNVAAGALCVLLGPSGCGKSTTLRLIAGLDSPNSGQIFIGGNDVTGLSPKDRGLAMVFQSYALFPHLTVGDNITFGLSVRGVPKPERWHRLANVIALTGLEGLEGRKPAQLSGGQRQRVALARAIIGEPSVCLMDEPLSNLDAALRHSMRSEIRALQQRLGMTMIYVTHDQVEAMTMADQIVLMNAGRIEQIGPPAEIYEHPASVFAAGFIGSPAMNIFRHQEKIIGVRPEHLHLFDDNNGHGGERWRVTRNEYLGADSLITLTTPHHETVIARQSGRVDLRHDQHVTVTWETRHEHRFKAPVATPSPIVLSQ